MKKKLSVAKFGGSLIDTEGKGIPRILKRICELKAKDDVGPIAVFSAPVGCTDELIRIGEATAQSTPASTKHVFQIYRHIAKQHIKPELLQQALKDIASYEEQTQAALRSVNKRFDGNVKAKVLTLGGELCSAMLMKSIMTNNRIEASDVPVYDWPVVTDDTFEDAVPNLEFSKKRLDALVQPLETGKIISLAGFLGVTSDGLETILGRGGSDLTCVFVSCLLKARYQTETVLYKDVPIQSADPKVVKGQKTIHVRALTYNEAHKASLMGMKIVQTPAIALARRFGQPLLVVPIDNPEEYSVIQAETSGREVVKCLTGKAGCAILSMNDEKSRSLEDMLMIWERRNDFLDLGAETLETGDRIRDFLFLDSEFLRRNEEKLKGFDENLRVEYGLGVVTLIGDRMKNSPGVASIAIGAITGINIKRAVFAPHTSQIIIVVEDKNVGATVAAIHLKMTEMNSSTTKNLT
jgi:aspartate kinase